MVLLKKQTTLKKYLFILPIALLGQYISAQALTKNGSVVTESTVNTLKVGTVTYPNTDGTSGQVLTTNGEGIVNWTTPSAVVGTNSVDLTTNQTIAGDKTFSGKITGVNSNLSGTLGIGTTTIDPSAQLEINSTDKGLLLPRLTSSQINEIANPTPGLLVFNTTLNAFQGYIGANPSQPNLFDWYTTQNYGYSRILQDYMINQTFTSQGQSVTSMDLATVNIGGINSGVFNLKIYDWNSDSNPLLYSADFSVSSVGKITIDFGSSITLPKGNCTIIISCISGAASFGIGGGSQGSLDNSYFESIGGTATGYTNPSGRPLAATLYTNGSMSTAKGSWHSF